MFVQPVDSWDAAIRKAKAKIAILTSDIEVFKDMKRAGEPWPGDSATRN